MTRSTSSARRSRRPAARRPHGGESPRPATPGPPPVASFAELPLPAPLLAALTAQGVTEPFPIQGATLPSALAGRDVLGRGRTGSGKTLAFGLALLARLTGRRAEPCRPLALVLVPTRELAQQVATALTPYADAVGLRMTAVVGGLPIARQATALRRGADVLVATPGRLADLLERGDCHLGDIAVTVLDEADQMTDMGFLPQVTRLLDRTPPGGQRMLFSATLDGDVDKLVRRFLDDPVSHAVDAAAGAVTAMEHHLLRVDDTDKQETAAHIAARSGQVIMFVRMKHAANRLVRKLSARGINAGALHGGRTQSQRDRTLTGFRTGELTVLVATDVAARGIHIDDLDLVVNVDPPADHKDYLHRAGRTARAGRAGTVVTLVLPDQRADVDELLAAAKIRPTTTAVRPGDAELTRITGARTPPGPAPAARPARDAAPSRDNAPRKGTSSRDTTSRKATSRDTGSRETAPRKAAPRETPARREAATSRGAASSRETASRKAAASRETTASRDVSAPREGAAGRSTPEGRRRNAPPASHSRRPRRAPSPRNS
ncbi:ATP-dependent RNA helicase RhlE [Actinomadura rubteroloni]|uniref:ATP-dependent RNA helicase RhlE n=1 Tax=Actinomadura rubteroloni TaxID=1926885 RepID=A0A2P4UR04_9ACTN|nr:DEAD/DEAH box helicase [Actinomadura rubteroloni]POM27482.1 ATP-dependent RNA helicase RhlE [Actinomadura rubteroloni]